MKNIERGRLFLIPVLVITALFLAFPLQEAVRNIIIEPMLYFFWAIGILYRSLPQFWLWVILMGIVFFIFLAPFLDDLPKVRRKGNQLPPQPGRIQSLAAVHKESSKGFYSKWVVANRLGKLIRNWVAYRDRLDQRWQANDLARLGWDTPDNIYEYLDAGINGSYADYPRPRIPFIQKRAKIPLDIDPNEVLDFLEKEMESESE